MRDSSGVRIVESAAPAWKSGQEWQVDTLPAVSIGLADGDTVYQFHGIRGADLLADGGLVVLDGGSAQLRRYGADGRHIWTAGGRGSGPGEFAQPAYLGRFGDESFALWDRAIARLTVFGTDGKLSRTASYTQADAPAPTAYGIFADGALLATVPNNAAVPSPGTLLVDTIGLWRVAESGADRRLLARLPGPIWLWTGKHQLPVPFTANPLRAVAGRQLAVASGPAPEIRIYDASGRLAARYLLPREAKAVGPGDVRSTVDYWVEQRYYGAPAEVWNEWLDRMPVPEHRPAFDRLVVSGEGHIWARRYKLDPETTVASVWDVFAADGAYLGAVATPSRFEITAISRAVMAGVFRDDQDVEYVRVYRFSANKNAER